MAAVSGLFNSLGGVYVVDVSLILLYVVNEHVAKRWCAAMAHLVVLVGR